MSTRGCIQPNPEIAGIGIRISIYIQTLATLVQAMFYAKHGVDLSELGASMVTLAITALSLALAAIIQAKTSGLSAYHALIVLNLSWVLIAGALIGSICAAPSGLNGFEVKSWKEERRFLQLRYGGTMAGLRFILFPTTHLLIVGSFGIWVWDKIDVFGNQPECTSEIFMTIFGHNIPVTNPAIRTFSLVVYAIAVIPVVNVLGIVTLAGGCSYILSKLFLRMKIGDKARTRLHYFSAICIPAFIIITFVVDTELMIRRNKAIIFAGESQWSFGQTLSMLLVFPVAANVYQKSYGALVGLEQPPARLRFARDLVISTYIARNSFTANLTRGDINNAIRDVLYFVDNMNEGTPPVQRSLATRDSLGKLAEGRGELVEIRTSSVGQTQGDLSI